MRRGDNSDDNAGDSRARGEPYGRAPRSARSVAAGDRTFRRRCRLNDRKENRLIVVNLFGLCSFPHQSCATGRIGLCVTSALLQPRHHGLPPHLRHYYPPPVSAYARHPFYMTTCAAATAACGPGAKMNLAYATGPFSVPNCPARPSRTTEDLILYGAVGCAATVPHRAHC